MFDKIDFITLSSEGYFTPDRYQKEHLSLSDYDQENMKHSSFFINATLESFSVPPIDDWTLTHLCHLEAFDIFHYKYGSYTQRQNFNSFQILYTYDGDAELKYENREYILHKGDIAFLCCKNPHYYKAITPCWSTAVLHFNGPLLPTFYETHFSGSRVVMQEAYQHKLQEYLETVLRIYAYPDAYRDWKAANCLDSMLIYLLELKTEADPKANIPTDLRYLIKYMENNYTSPLTLDYLAEFASMSKYHLSRLFKKHTGFSPNDYLITLRINRARSLLTTTTLPASKIAVEVGIPNVNNFINLFKKKTGMTPIQYRNANI